MNEAPVTSPVALHGVRPEQLPRHIAAIMDGNGRWAQQQGLPRLEGHRRGVGSVRRVTEECARLGLEVLTLYCLSSENWKRPAAELRGLLMLLQQYLVEERRTFQEHNIRLRFIGRRDRLPPETLREMDRAVEFCSQHTGLNLVLAIDYGGRAEVVMAARKLAEEVRSGLRSVESIDESAIAACLDTQGLRDPDLLIRTGGEMRVSNFLLWQISYAELWVTDRYWPEFRVEDLHAAMRSFAARDRRFGGLTAEEPAALSTTPCSPS